MYEEHWTQWIFLPPGDHEVVDESETMEKKLPSKILIDTPIDDSTMGKNQTIQATKNTDRKLIEKSCSHSKLEILGSLYGGGSSKNSKIIILL